MDKKNNNLNIRISLVCYMCLCEVCTLHKCPHLENYRKYRHGERMWGVEVCFRQTSLGNCPVVKCDFFNNRQRKKVYVVRKYKPVYNNRQLLEEIAKKLDIDF